MMKSIQINTQSSIRMDASRVIYFDPFKIEKETHDADLIFITHEHFDHLSPEDYGKVAKEDTLFVVPKSLEKHMEGLRYETIVAGEKRNIGGFDVEAVPAYNTNKPHHKKEFGWLGYVVSIDGQTYYIPGDMDHTKEAEQVKCDVCFLPIGGTYTMTAQEAVKLANMIHPKTVIPYHYGSIVGTKQDEETFKMGVDSDIEVQILLKI